MTAEITAEMLAREMCRIDGMNPDAAVLSVGNAGYAWQHYEEEAEAYLLAARAYAALQAQPTEAPGRVRCWMNRRNEMTVDPVVARSWYDDEGLTSIVGHFTPGHFIPEAHE